MPQILEYLADNTRQASRQVADRFDEEARELEDIREKGLREEKAALEAFRRRVLSAARTSTVYVISRAAEAEGLWESAIQEIKGEPPERGVPFLQTFLDLFEDGLRLFVAPRHFWGLAEKVGVPPESQDELQRAGRSYQKMAREAKLAISHRTEGWHPKDPQRLERGMRQGSEAIEQFRKAKA